MLVTCPECGEKISERANPCPACGYPNAGAESEENLQRDASLYNGQLWNFFTYCRKCGFSGSGKAWGRLKCWADNKSRSVWHSMTCPKCGYEYKWADKGGYDDRPHYDVYHIEGATLPAGPNKSKKDGAGCLTGCLIGFIVLMVLAIIVYFLAR